MTRKQKRLAIIGGGVAFLTAAVLLVMFAFSQAVAYFYVPGDLAKADVAPGRVSASADLSRRAPSSAARAGPSPSR